MSSTPFKFQSKIKTQRSEKEEIHNLETKSSELKSLKKYLLLSLAPSKTFKSQYDDLYLNQFDIARAISFYIVKSK